jgi:hypothetical protein
MGSFLDLMAGVTFTRRIRQALRNEARLGDIAKRGTPWKVCGMAVVKWSKNGRQSVCFQSGVAAASQCRHVAPVDPGHRRQDGPDKRAHPGWLREAPRMTGTHRSSNRTEHSSAHSIPCWVSMAHALQQAPVKHSGLIREEAQVAAVQQATRMAHEYALAMGFSTGR